MPVVVTRDGIQVSPKLEDENAGWIWILKHQGMSVHWAMQHEGYAITDADAYDRAHPAPEPVSVCTPHPYMDMPQYIRIEMGVPAGVTQCRQPIIGGGSCLATKDAPFHQ